MKYNDTIVGEYGKFVGISGESPLHAKSVPSSKDYIKGKDDNKQKYTNEYAKLKAASPVASAAKKLNK